MYFQDGQVLEISQVNDIRLGLPPKINVSRLTSHVCLWLCDGDCIGCTSWKRVPVCVGVLGGGGGMFQCFISLRSLHSMGWPCSLITQPIYMPRRVRVECSLLHSFLCEPGRVLITWGDENEGNLLQPIEPSTELTGHCPLAVLSWQPLMNICFWLILPHLIALVDKEMT